MKNESVRHYLKEYKFALDWIDIYDSKFEANMGMCYSHAPGGSGVNSDVENKVIDRDEQYPLYEEKRGYCKIIEKVLEKLPEDETLVIEHEFNLINDDFYSRFPVGNVPYADIIANISFSKSAYYRKRDEAYRLIGKYLGVI